MGNIFEKKKIKVEKMKTKIYNFLCKIECRLKILITKTSILSNHYFDFQNISARILKVLEYLRVFEGICKRFLG